MQGPWQSGGWDSSVCDFSFSLLRADSIPDQGARNQYAMQYGQKEKKHTCKCHLNLNNRLPYTHDK